jgi:muconolactone delta-isomerase
MTYICNIFPSEFITFLCSLHYTYSHNARNKGGEMKFLVVTKSKMPFPPEMAPGIVDAVEEWTRKYTAKGQLEQIWSFAGLQGGGGIANVNSLEELDAIMTEFPIAPFSDIEVYGLVDFEASVGIWKEAAKAMAPPIK